MGASVEQGYHVLCLTDNVDEFCIKMMRDYKGKAFKSITDGDLSLETEDEKEEIETLTEEYKHISATMKKRSGDKVSQGAA